MTTGWFKSSYSGAADDNCVEVRFTDTTTDIRDSKNAHGDTLRVTTAAWTAFLTGLAKA